VNVSEGQVSERAEQTGKEICEQPEFQVGQLERRARTFMSKLATSAA
jgi:hypothetical protein